MTHAIERADMKEPPAFEVEWAVRMPAQNAAEALEARASALVPKGGIGSIVEVKISRRVPRTAYVRARTWFAARAAAALYWARKGVHFNPQSIREGEVLP